jgi:hypothetical protein
MRIRVQVVIEAGDDIPPAGPDAGADHKLFSSQ